MAQMLEVSCGKCGEREIQLDGPVFAGFRPRCEQCGNSRVVPWSGRAGGDLPPGLSGDARAEWIADAAGTCSCGGRFSPTAPLRCSRCRSTDVSTTFAGIAD